MANTSFPDSAVVYILDDIPGQGEFQGTGVIIGPHTILTASHLLYDADTGAVADAISLYPGFTPDTTTYNPAGALGGSQTIHGLKVDDRGDGISARATQQDYAIIDTTADLSAYGSFALDPNFTSGDVVVKGYPASNDGHLTGAEGVVGQDGTLSDIGTAALPLSPGYSGGPLYDTVERDGRTVQAVVGTVSTNDDAMKLTRSKVARIRAWIASDQAFDDGGGSAPKALVPQISGTVSGRVDAAAVSAPTTSGATELAAAIAFGAPHGSRGAHHGGSARHAAHPQHAAHQGAVPGPFADLVSALQAPAGSGDVSAAAALSDGGTALAAPREHHAHGHHAHARPSHGRITGDA